MRAAAAVIQRHDGFLLMAQRPPGRGWSGWWEFPGGKIEINESPFEALQRELQEEINISANDATLWFELVKSHHVRINYWIGKTHLVYQFPQYCLPIYLC